MALLRSIYMSQYVIFCQPNQRKMPRIVCFVFIMFSLVKPSCCPIVQPCNMFLLDLTCFVYVFFGPSCNMLLLGLTCFVFVCVYVFFGPSRNMLLLGLTCRLIFAEWLFIYWLGALWWPIGTQGGTNWELLMINFPLLIWNYFWLDQTYGEGMY